MTHTHVDVHKLCKTACMLKQPSDPASSPVSSVSLVVLVGGRKATLFRRRRTGAGEAVRRAARAVLARSEH